MSPFPVALALLVAAGGVPARSAPAGPQRSTLFAGTLSPQAGTPDAGLDRWLAEDKLQHFAMSFAATGMAYGGARMALEPASARMAAVGLAALLGVGKELMDVRRGGPFSLKDLAWDAAGVALGYTFVQHID